MAPLMVDRGYRRVLAHADQALVLQKGQVVLQGRADAVAGSAAMATYLGVREALRNSSKGNVALALVEYKHTAINSGVILEIEVHIGLRIFHRG